MILPGCDGGVLRGASRVMPGEHFREPGPARDSCVRLGFVLRRFIAALRQIWVAALAFREN